MRVIDYMGICVRAWVCVRGYACMRFGDFVSEFVEAFDYELRT